MSQTVETLKKIDAELSIPEGAEAYQFFDPQHKPFVLTGRVKGTDSGYRRISAAQIDAIGERLNANARIGSASAAGLVLRFRTDSPTLAFTARQGSLGHMSHFAFTGSHGIAFYLGSGRNRRYLATPRPPTSLEELYQGMLRPLNHDLEQSAEPAGKGKPMREWLLYLPTYGELRSLAIGIEPGARLAAPKPQALDKPVLFYGSSITQGGCASQPGNVYPSLLTRWLDVPQINLGFSGGGLAEPEIADLIAAQEMSCFVLDLDHNLSTLADLDRLHEPFFKRVRAAQPNLPIIILSRPDVDAKPDYSRQAQRIIYRTYRNALKASDTKVWWINGNRLFGRHERDACAVDRCHPNDLGFYRMAKTIQPTLSRILGVNRSETPD